jgi:hypothetical protein
MRWRRMEEGSEEDAEEEWRSGGSDGVEALAVSA